MKRTVSFVICFALLILVSCRLSGIERIIIKGSDTEVHLSLELAEEYMKNHPDISISVSGGGSGTGIAALINNKTDIANSSRKMKEEEIDLAIKNGINPYEFIYALDALAFIVHPDNPISELTLSELQSVYNGDVRNWKDLNGNDLSIQLYGRQSNSGTYIYVRDYVVKGEYHKSIKQMNGTAQILEAVHRDPGGIGYVGVGFLTDRHARVRSEIKPINLISDSGEIKSPLDNLSIFEGTYPLVRPLYQITNGIPKGAVRDFIEFQLSLEGQKIVIESGFYPVNGAVN
jgi:phosphate transport system substrate-binding protein